MKFHSFQIQHRNQHQLDPFYSMSGIQVNNLIPFSQVLQIGAQTAFIKLILLLFKKLN